MIAGYRKLVGRELVPCDVLEWARWFEDADGRRVGDDNVPAVGHAAATRVSTVCLGSDHGFGGKPLWFETCLFPGDVVERYATYAEAEAGHRAWVERVRGGWRPGREYDDDDRETVAPGDEHYYRLPGAADR